MQSFRVRVEGARQLAFLKVETEKTEQEMIAEALNLLFKQYSKPPAA